MARIERVTVGSSPMDICLAVPEVGERRPAVLVMHHRYGVETFTHGVCDGLAQWGYVAAAPDLYHRRPAAEDLDAKRAAIRDDETLADIRAALDFLAAHPAVRWPEVAVLGHCLGGRMALVAASAFPVFRGAVAYYGGHMFKAYGEGLPTPFERLAEIRCPVLGLYGNDDFNPAPAEVDRIEAELRARGIPHAIHRYDEAGHGFAHVTIPALYREAADKDAGRRALGFLRRVLPLAVADARPG